MSKRRVYIIEIFEPWIHQIAPNAEAGRRCFYVGETGKSVGKRYHEHRHPRKNDSKTGPGKVFKKIQALKGAPLQNKVDTRLRRTMFTDLPEVETKDEAERREAATVDQLRREGHIVFPKDVGSKELRIS